MANPVSNAALTAADAAALAAHANGTPPHGSNSGAMKEAFFDRCKIWGEKAGAGDTSKVGVILELAKSGWDETAVVADGARAYAAFYDSRKKKAGEMGKRIATTDGKSRENRVSEFEKYLKVGGLPLIRDTDQGGYGVLKRAVEIIRNSPDIRGETEDLLSKVATAQKRQPAVPLADDQIISAFAPRDKPDRTEADLWGNLRTQIDSIMTKYPASPQGASQGAPSGRQDADAKTARACVQKIIDDLGGTAAENARRDKEAAKALRSAAGAKQGKKRRRR